MESKARLIGVTGRKQSGKDTVFALLNLCEPGAQRMAFADPLKLELAKACGVTIDFIESHKSQFRTALQWWGTEFRRGMFGDDYWIKKLEHYIRAADVRVPLIVVTDVRFPNEADLIKKLGGELWRVQRPSMASNDIHPSETAMDNYATDRLILNDGLLGYLRDKVSKAYKTSPDGGNPTTLYSIRPSLAPRTATTIH